MYSCADRHLALGISSLECEPMATLASACEQAESQDQDGLRSA